MIKFGETKVCMIATQNQKEEELLTKVRMMSNEQVNSLLSFLNTIVTEEEFKLKSKVEFLNTMRRISESAQKKGLTEEILKDILESHDS